MKFVWTADLLKVEALKFKTRGEWAKKSKSSYLAARRLGLLDELSGHMALLVDRNKWTLKSLEKEALKFNSKGEWQTKSPSSYCVARKRGLLAKLSKHMSRPKAHNFKWTKELVLEDAKLYSSRKKWQKSSPAWKVAQRNGWLEEACQHMDILRKKWTKDLIFNEAKKYQTLMEWVLNSKNTYQYAQKNGWLEEMSSHMNKVGGISMAEKELLAIIKQKYPKAHSTFFTVKDPKFHPAKRFQLDIYVPELRKGIEFNGDYWHSFEGLARSRKPNGWTDKQIENYHNLKKNFFESKKIEIFNIWEKDWNRNRSFCVDACLSFLALDYKDKYECT